MKKMTVKAIEALKPVPNKAVTKISLGERLFIYVRKSGHKSFVQEYTHQNKNFQITLGTYPELSLKEAYILSAKVRGIVFKGGNPKSALKQSSPNTHNEPTFEQVAREYCYIKLKNKIWTQKHHDKSLGRINNHLFPVLKNIPLSLLSLDLVRKTFNTLIQKGLGDQSHRIRQLFKGIISYAKAQGHCSTQLKLEMFDLLSESEFLPRRPAPKNFPALTEVEDISEFFRDCRNYSGEFLTVKLLELSALLFTRPSELRTLAWDNVLLKEDKLVYKVRKGGFERDHIVPLSKQAKLLFLELYIHTGSHDYVFYSPRSKYETLSENTVNAAIRRLGWGGKMTGHGFRAMAMTTILEHEGIDVDKKVIKAQLSHLNLDKTDRSYDRSTYLEQRKVLMQKWSDFLYSIAS